MDLSWLKGVAPTVASALGGPLAGVAVTALGNALGWKDATKDDVTKMLSTSQLSGEQLAAVKTAELELKQHESDNNFKFAELEIRDRESARAMQIATKSSTPEILSWMIVVGFFALNGYLIVAGNPEALADVILGRIQGSIDMAFGTVLAFWLGTSQGSRNKDMVIAANATK
jgi:hypothetical protein